jgi:hypothetical protein
LLRNLTAPSESSLIVNSFFWIWSLRNPQTNLSRRVSFKFNPNSQNSVNFLSSAMYALTLSHCSWFRLWNRKRSAIKIGFGVKWSLSKFTRVV